MKKLTLQEIKERYPHPVAAGKDEAVESLSKDTTQEYCIGGAFCLSLEQKTGALRWHVKDSRFPTRFQLARYLAYYDNNHSSSNFYLTLASIIIDFNDRYRFEEVWELLGQFLTDVNKREGSSDEETYITEH